MSPEGKEGKTRKTGGKAAGMGHNSPEEGYLDGQLLIAMPVMSDPRFERSVIYMCAHSSEGAMGIIVNRPAGSIDFPGLLVQLDPEVAAAVLHALPAEHQPEIVHRIATLEPVSPEALVMLDELLTRRIAERHGSGTLTMGGPREAADIINGAGKAVEKRVLPEIAKLDKMLARKIEEEMFKFEHLFVLDANPMGALLRETDNDTLIDALKGVAENERECFFRAMSSRAADGVRDEIAARGRTKLADVVEAQKRVVAIARKLAAEGTIVFGSGDGDYV